MVSNPDYNGIQGADITKSDVQTMNMIKTKNKIQRNNNEISNVSNSLKFNSKDYRAQDITSTNNGNNFKVQGETRMIKFNNKHQNQHFDSNYIRTTKYTIYNFLFLALAYQYLRFSNCYFLLVMILSCTDVSPVSPITAINPVLFVLFVSLLREAIEDYGRYKQDKEQNEQKISVLDGKTGDFIRISCQDLKVGDFVLVHQDDTFPADLILLSSSKEQGECFIATASLDGEKNLKKRVQPKNLKYAFPNEKYSVHSIFNTIGHIECELPNKNLHSFSGQIVIGEKNYALTEKQLLMKGANLKNTDWALAICVYTGHDTKIMLNSQKGRQKMSHLESKLNKLVIFVVLS